MSLEIMRPFLVRGLFLAAGLLALGWLLIRVCADGGAMGSAYRTCECTGFEWRAYDRTAADGPRRTICFGVIRSSTCLQSRGGPEVPCD